MKAQFENKIMSSILLYLDHKVLEKGEAFTNHSGLFYPISDSYDDYNVYALPFKQVVNDSSISSANILSGVYVNSNFVTGGQSGLHSVNHYQGQAFFTQDRSSDTLSGNYAVKDFNFYLTSQPEETLLFDTKFKLNPKYDQTLTGLAENEQTYPAVYLKNVGGSNVPFAFGGQDKSLMTIRAVVVSDSSFKLDAVNSIFRDLNKTNFALFQSSDLPFNALGSTTDGSFNYNTLSSSIISDASKSVHVENVIVNKVSNYLENGKKLNKNVYLSYVDFDLEIPRFPRQ
tara:strand:+ start:354 stop:1211 length:858 start_codon:yes stop_codon:yes gene_type:complete